MNKFSICSFILIFIAIIGVSASDPPIFKYISNNDLPAISEFILTNDINGIYGTDSTTLLVYSIHMGSNEVIKFLLSKGADPDKYIDDKNPLIHAVESGSKIAVRLLLEHHANINAIDNFGNHSLIYAATLGNIGMIKLLLRNGAYLNHKNSIQYSAYDFAIRSNNIEAAKYLKLRFEKRLPDMQDGPFITWKKNDRIMAYYLAHDSAKNISKKISVSFNSHTEPYIINGFYKDDFDYMLWKSAELPPYQYNTNNKIMIIGDIHGGYDSLVKFLKNNHVIDSNLNWIWNDGHLVFLGDIFDRGSKVTEALWLIYRLEHQAFENGGYVHYLLGNHEILVLLKNQLYVADKYYYLCKKLRMTYGHLYSKKSVLGKWLRTKNTIIKINDNLFVHAGISKEIADLNLTPDEMNNMIRFFLNHPERNRKFGPENKDLLLGMKGPFWYRGYLEESPAYPKISESELDQILEMYNVSRIFIGHTNVDRITNLFNNRVFIMDVPFYTSGKPMQVLLIEDDSFYYLNSSGEKVEMYIN